MFRLFSLWIVFLGSSLSISAQTCCSGGVPLSSNLGLPAAGMHNLQVALTYDLNVLNTLKEGISQLDDQSRNRKTHSMLLQIGYSISKKISIDALFAYVRQERTIQNDLNRNFVQTAGLGDAVLLLKYNLWERQDQSSRLTIGIGSKLPTGAADQTNDQGILLNADLQPGSGATDLIFWSQFTQSGVLRPSMVLFATLTHNRRGINPNYLPLFNPTTGQSEGQRYQFGNEWQLMAGLSDRLLWGKLIMDPGLSLRFRSVQYDRINDQRLPSTGGSWWFVNPGLTWWAKDTFSFNVNVELPVYANIIGTQLSPSFRLNTGFFYRIPLKKEAGEIPSEIRIF